MSIKLSFLSAVIRKQDLASHFPGGLAAFQQIFHPAIEDDDLYALCSMSGGELGETIEKIAAAGFDSERMVAVGDMWSGPFNSVAGISFTSEHTDGTMPVWYARAGGAPD